MFSDEVKYFSLEHAEKTIQDISQNWCIFFMYTLTILILVKNPYVCQVHIRNTEPIKCCQNLSSNISKRTKRGSVFID